MSNINQIVANFPKFIKQIEDAGFTLVSAIEENNSFELTIRDAYGLKYTTNVSNDDRYFDVELIDYIG